MYVRSGASGTFSVNHRPAGRDAADDAFSSCSGLDFGNESCCFFIMVCMARTSRSSSATRVSVLLRCLRFIWGVKTQGRPERTHRWQMSGLESSGMHRTFCERQWAQARWVRTSAPGEAMGPDDMLQCLLLGTQERKLGGGALQTVDMDHWIAVICECFEVE